MKKGTGMVLLLVSCRRALFDLSDNVATRVQSVFYLDAADALRKALNEGRRSSRQTCVRRTPICK
jgi:ATP-dependent Lon protease